MRKRLGPLFLCCAIGIVAYICLDYWSARNAPLYKRLESQWYDDVKTLEASKKLPGGWYDVRDLEVYGGTPESRGWLQRIKVPLKTVKDGHFKLEVLVVVWEEDGKRGTLVQYNLVDLESKNNIWELGRTFILSRPEPVDPFTALWHEFKP